MPKKSHPLSIRLTPSLDAFIAEEARRTRRSKGAVVASLAEEALRTRHFPGIAFRGHDWNRRAWVMGTALDVWEVIQAVQDFGSAERLLAESDLAEPQLRVALAYAADFEDEIEQAIAENRSAPEELHRQYPMIDVRAAV